MFMNQLHKKSRLKLLFISVLAAVSVPSHAWAIDLDESNHVLSFEDVSALENEDLDNLRGGFVTSNGMVLDFSFSANTLVDGELINQVVFNTIENSINRNSLKNIIQVGDGNVAFSSDLNSQSLPDVLTIVQNNIDDLTIQQINLFDVTVQNMNNYIQQAVSPEIDFQSSIAFSP